MSDFPTPESGTPRPKRDRLWLEHLRRTGTQELATASPPPELGLGVAQFNDQRFFESHETWEGPWRSAEYPLRLFYLALTKLGAGFTHAQRGNAKGARRLLANGLQFLGPFLPRFMGVDTRRLDREIRQWLLAAQTGPPGDYPQVHQGTALDQGAALDP